MPTASPSMTPSTGVTEAMLTTPENDERRGDADGDADERRDDRERRRDERAERHDEHDRREDEADRLADAEELGDALREVRAEVRPSRRRSGWDSKWSIVACFASSGSSRRVLSKVTLTIAVEPSSETTPMPSARSSRVEPSSTCSDLDVEVGAARRPACPAAASAPRSARRAAPAAASSAASCSALAPAASA